MKKVFGKLKVQLYLGYALTFMVITVMLFSVIMLGIMMSQIGQSRLDVLKQISERSNSIKNSIITLSNL